MNERQNYKHYDQGYTMGQEDRQAGVTQPTYYRDTNGFLVCWEMIFARRVKHGDETAMAMGYMDAYCQKVTSTSVN